MPLVFTLIIGAAIGYVYWCLVTLPDISRLEEFAPYKASALYSYDNELLTEFYIERRNYIPCENIPRHVKQAFIAVEDKRFYTHHGVDIIRIFGALIKDIEKKSFVQGGSTITQQLAKMLFLGPEKIFTRKIQEAALSLQLERKYSKEEILGFYLNQTFLGTGAYGVEAASQTYFNKSVQHISIAEAALLATLPRAPSKNAPFKNLHKARKRRKAVLKKMYALGYISRDQHRQAAEEMLPEKLHGRLYKAPYFVDYIKGVLESKYGDRLYTSGLKIYTTLDFELQKKAEKVIDDGIRRLTSQGIDGVQAALVVVDVADGRIKAMVGGADYRISQFNRAVQARRQPGSVFKPIVYLAALNQGYRPDDIIVDRKRQHMLQEGIWVPQNYDNVYMGRVSLQKALSKSLNTATVNLAKKVGIENIITTAKKLGISSVIRPYYSSALGASEMTLLEMTSAYATLSQGYRISAVGLDRIIDREQKSQRVSSPKRQRVIEPSVVQDMKRMLRSVIVEGTGRRAKVLRRRAYGKTGTTNANADAWFVGFDDRLVTGVWVGRDNGTSIGSEVTGASAALPIWIEFMKSI
ncbi:MAG: PBP1A family penicillin-binding protein [Deltaproteobacteria bacterium]|nr:PBP1A family penicillin-binding protein [Deltaproteobacteria bacterium]